MKLHQVRAFVREYRWRVLFLSALVLVPCFWHKRIEAGDLPSHTYNAWLAQLIHRGQAPGLYIQPRWNNIVVDLALEKLGAILGFLVAERILVVTCVLLFFWGTFALLAAAHQRPPWNLVPAIAMITYGWTFYAGFMNFYLSMALGFLAVALLWRGTSWNWLFAALLLLLALLAHPMGFICALGLAVYFRLGEELRGWKRWSLFASAFLAVVIVHFFLKRFRTAFWHTKDFYFMSGPDQLVLFRAHYTKLALAVFCFAVFCFVYGLYREWKEIRSAGTYRSPLELWLALVFAAAMIPEVIWFSEDPMPFALAVSRLTLVTAVLGLCAVASVKPRPWHLWGFTLCALVFFIWTYQDTKILSDMEGQAEALVSNLPFGRRVVETINLEDDSRLWFVNHIVDRACIGRCFSYSNYEPATKQFRVRVRPGSPVVTDSVDDNLAMETGFYVVREKDLPLNQIYQCDDKDLSKLCIRELSAGEENGRIGYRPTPRF